MSSWLDLMTLSLFVLVDSLDSQQTEDVTATAVVVLVVASVVSQGFQVQSSSQYK